MYSSTLRELVEIRSRPQVLLGWHKVSLLLLLFVFETGSPTAQRASNSV